jgi:hypothetical protein
LKWGYHQEINNGQPNQENHQPVKANQSPSKPITNNNQSKNQLNASKSKQLQYSNSSKTKQATIESSIEHEQTPAFKVEVLSTSVNIWVEGFLETKAPRTLVTSVLYRKDISGIHRFKLHHHTCQHHLR